MTPSAQPQARPGLKPLDDALAELLAFAQALEGMEPVATFDADGRVLAQDVVSALHVPPQDNSSMDGYALRVADVAVPAQVLPVSQRIAAGSSGAPLQAGTAARIFTGAPIPAGADAVVMQEDCQVMESEGGQGAGGQPRIAVQSVPEPGQWIRRAGEDVSRGAVVLARGKRLTPAEIGLAASIGMHTLQVARAPRVALFSTGDELVDLLGRQPFARLYTPADVALLVDVDRAMGTLSGPATACVLRRQRDVFGDERFQRLGSISVGHLYNLRHSAGYRNQRVVLTKTQPTKASMIGVRKAPAPEGRPGFVRIDSVHQGDLDGIKGLYHINAVDCVTQFELVASCERISEAYLLPVLEIGRAHV